MEEKKYLGLGVIFLGIGLLCFTFYLAYSAFMGPAMLARFLDLVPSLGGGLAEDVANLASYALAIALLFVMGYIGGKVVKIGMDLYLGE